MAKKRKPPLAVAKQQREKQPVVNRFELKRNKRKFDVMGRRVKGDTKNVVQARQDAVTKRKKTLLVEYKQLRKANVFIDRRFGEGDASVPEEDKALVRLKAQRLRDARRSSRFALADNREDGGEEGATLTHGGIPLDALEDLSQRPDALADLDDAVLEGLEREFQFGGGVAGGRAAGDGGEADGSGGEGEQRRSRRQVMEEVIAKSKAYKAIRAQQKEADLQQLADLDSAFREIVTSGPTGGSLAHLLNPPGHNKGAKGKPTDAGDAEYDAAARTLVFDAKGQATDRTMTREELEELERQRLERLEAERLRRMRAAAAGGDDDGDDGVNGGGGGFAARRAKRARHESGDALGDDFDLDGGDSGDGSGDDSAGEGEEGGGGGSGGVAPTSALEARRQRQAAGGHALQVAFREQAALLLAKHRLQSAKRRASDGGEGVGDGGEGVGDGDAGVSASDAEGGVESGDDGGEGAETDGAGADSEGEGEAADARGGSRGAGARDAAAAPPPSSQRQQQAQRRAAGGGAGALEEGPPDLPFTIPLPASYQAFAALVEGRPARDLGLAVARIRGFNAPVLAADGRRKTQELYGVLLQHFAALAGQAPLPSEHLDTLLRPLLDLAAQVPLYAATAARARLSQLSARLGAALSDPLAAPLHGWPSGRALALLRLLTLTFPASDRRHPVTTPLALLLGRWLGSCSAASPLEAALGVALASLCLDVAAAGRRYAPEPITFLAAVLASAAAEAPPNGGGVGGGGGRAVPPRLLALSAPVAAAAGGEAAAPPRLPLAALLGAANAAAAEAAAAARGAAPPMPAAGADAAAGVCGDVGSDAFKAALLGTAIATCHAAVAMAAPLDAAPEALAPLSAAAAALAGCARFARAAPPALAAALAALQAALHQSATAAVERRRPLVRAARGGGGGAGGAAGAAPKEFNPRFESEFARGVSYDPDRQRALELKLKRQVAKERRGAMRELRRDAAFMADARDRERTQVDAERLASEKSFYSEMQRFEADMRSGGQGGMNAHVKGAKKRK